MMCKKHYFDTICNELGVNTQGTVFTADGNHTYQPTTESMAAITKRHKQIAAGYGIMAATNHNKLPYVYMIPKLHKNPYGNRFITSAKNSVIQPVSEMLHKILAMLRINLKKYCDAIKCSTGINCFWSVNSSFEVLDRLNSSGTARQSNALCSYDFSTLFTSLPHELVQREIFALIDRLVKQSTVVVTKHSAFLKRAGQQVNNGIPLSKTDTKELVTVILREAYATFGGLVLKQAVGVGMGMSSSAMLADLTLAHLEFRFLSDRQNWASARQLQHTYRYQDDLLSLAPSTTFGVIANQIYPDTLPRNQTNNSVVSTSYLDFVLSLQPFNIRLYNKTDDFPFRVARYIFSDSNVHSSMGVRVFTTQLVRFCRICLEKDEFITKSAQMRDIFIHHGYKKETLLAAFLTFGNRHLNSLLKYQVHNQRELAIMANLIFQIH